MRITLAIIGVAQSASDTPLGRLGMPEEIVLPAIYLMSDDGAFVTGFAFVIDGGWTL